MRPLRDPSTVRPKHFFPLTPFADAMFQLLIFFMLSSSLAPYSLIPLSAGAVPAGPAAPAAPAPAAAKVAVLQLGRGSVKIGAATVALADLPAKLAELKAGGVERAVVLTARASTVQDVATALEALSRGGIGKVQLVAAAGG